MPETKVKICGLQDVEVLKSIINLPIDYIGLVFAPSRRRVSLATAAELVSILPNWESGATPKSVGVVVNPKWRELEELLSAVSLDIIQLHGQETPDFCREIKRKFPQVQIWKALTVAGKDNSEAIADELGLDNYTGSVDAVLLDTYDPLQRGGSGRTFAWEEIPAYKEMAIRCDLPLFIAGGLHPENVKELLDSYAPDGVDVSSGVESDGIKDIAKMTAFVERVKQS